MVARVLIASAISFHLSIACLFAQQSQATTSPRERLQQYVTQLQASPSDDALRTKIIQLALSLDPRPAVPQDAAIDAAKGKTIFASATTPDDMKAAAAAFAQASNEAPWVPDYYYNEGLALEKAKQYDGAISALNFYLLAAPNAADAADVRGKIEGIRYDEQKLAADQQADMEHRAERFVGRWGDNTGRFVLEIRLNSIKPVLYQDGSPSGDYEAAYSVIPPPSGPFPCNGCSATVDYELLNHPSFTMYHNSDKTQDRLAILIVADIQMSVGPLREFVDHYLLNASFDSIRLIGEKQDIYKEGRTSSDIRNQEGKITNTNVTLYRQ